MATTLAMIYPDIFAAVGVHSGLLHGVVKSFPDALGVMQGGTGPLAGGNKAKGAGWASDVPAIMFHGDRDTTVPPPQRGSRGRPVQHIASSRSDGSARQRSKGRGYTCTTHRDASGKPCLEQWRIHGGMAWSGGSKKGSYTDPQGPDAAREMLRFFCQHRQIVS
ncbi:PHB depolymerase family esterase [Halomonas sp. IOP_14]|nr:PHB depolymerase family esterase [Halomonas sp. IOP_14]